MGIDITNAGKLAGKEAVLLYLSDLYASITPEVKALKVLRKLN
jgi:beta-glucosidase